MYVYVYTHTYVHVCLCHPLHSIVNFNSYNLMILIVSSTFSQAGATLHQRLMGVFSARQQKKEMAVKPHEWLLGWDR